MNEPHKFVLNLSQKLDLRSSNKHVALQNTKQHYKNNKLKIIPPTWNDEFNYQMVLISFQISKIILSLS